MSNFIVINEIEELLNDMNDGLTSKLNTISTNISTLLTNTGVNNTASTTGTLSQKISSTISNTAATTTENSSGTLSAKLTYLINRRNKMITPSSTNLKTLASSGSKSTGTYVTNDWGGANGQTYSCYVKYPGVYRIYCTASGSAAPPSSNHSFTSGGSARIVLHAYVNSNTSASSVVINTVSIAAKNTTYPIASTTKYCDINASAGDKISVYIRGESYRCCLEPCGSGYYTYNITFSWTDISIRGTASEITSAIV